MNRTRLVLLVAGAYVVAMLASLGVVWFAMATAMRESFVILMARGSGPSILASVALGVSIVFTAVIVVVGRSSQ